MIFLPEVIQKYRLYYLRLRTLEGSKRYFIFNIIETHQPIIVGDIVKASSFSQPIISQIVSVLRKSNFVTANQVNKNVFYSSNQEEIVELIGFCHKLLDLDSTDDMLLKNNYSKIQMAFKYLKYLLNSGRMILLEILNKRGSLSVNDLAELSEMKQSLVSQNLSILKGLGCISSNKKGKQTIYSINKTKIDLLRSIVN